MYADYGNCSVGDVVEIINKFQKIKFLQLPTNSSPTKNLPKGVYKVIDKKFPYVKLESTEWHKTSGWLNRNTTLHINTDTNYYQTKSLSGLCSMSSQIKNKNTNNSFPINYDSKSTFSLNANIGSNFYIIEENTQQRKAELTNYQKKLVKKSYNFAITDYYSYNLPFTAYGEIITSDKSPARYSEVENYFNNLKQSLNISYSTKIIKFNDEKNDYYYRKFNYNDTLLWEWLTDSKDVDYFKDFKNCFSGFFNDLPKNNKTITYAISVTSFHKDAISQKDIKNYLKSIYLKDYKLPTAYYDFKSGSGSNEKYQVKNKNTPTSSNIGSEYLYCADNKSNYVTRYSTNNNKNCPVGYSKTSQLAWIDYESQRKQVDTDSDSKSLAKSMELVLDRHFNKNHDYYILGLDNKGNKLLGSANFIDPNEAKPISRGKYYYLKNTYDQTVSNPCFFTSIASSNRTVSNELRAKGKIILNCNGKTLAGLWEKKGNLGTFVTDDKTIYGVFKNTPFDHLGTYLLPKNTYNLVSANSIYDNVRSGNIEDPAIEYNKISDRINIASSQFYQNQSSTDLVSTKASDTNILYCQNPTTKRVYETTRINCVGIDKEIPKSVYDRFYSSDGYIYCENYVSGRIVRFSKKLKPKCTVGFRQTSELAWNNFESQNNKKIQTQNVDTIFDTSEVKIVNASPLNIRETPNGQWLAILSKGEKVAILDKNNDNSWNKIISEDGQIGWVSSKYLVDDLSNIEENNKNPKIVSQNNEFLQEQEPEIKVTKKTFDEIKPSISCLEKEIFTKEKTALIDCKITDNDKVLKVYIEGNEVNFRANRIQEEFPVVIGKSELEIQVFDRSGNETKEFVIVEREFSFVNQFKQFDPLKPGLINSPVNRNRIAIIIGIKDYKDIPDTKYADRDAFTFIDYANETLGINNSNIKYFINDDAGFFDFKTIDKWLSTKINKNTEVFFFYSGHGANNNGQSLLLPLIFEPI